MVTALSQLHHCIQ